MRDNKVDVTVNVGIRNPADKSGKSSSSHRYYLSEL